MSLNFLAQLAGRQLPYRTGSPVEQLHISVLTAARLIVADTAPVDAPLSREEAVVHAITPTGLELIKLQQVL